MPKHADLKGAELHSALLKLEGPSRAPAFAGETIFDPTTKKIHVATSTAESGWVEPAAAAPQTPPAAVATPIIFHWSLDLELLGSGYNLRLGIIRTTYNLNAGFIPLESVYTGQVGLAQQIASECALDITRFVTLHGNAFYYFPVLRRANGNQLQPVPYGLTVTEINTSKTAADNIVQIVPLTNKEDELGNLYTQLAAIRVVKALSHVVVKVTPLA